MQKKKKGKKKVLRSFIAGFFMCILFLYMLAFVYTPFITDNLSD
jgi:hypothetical protein